MSRKRTVYSTNPEYVNRFFEEEAGISIPPEKQRLRVWLDRIKGNKEITRINGFECDDITLKDLCKELKMKCGAGGSVKDMEILLQGDHRDKAIDMLKEAGYGDVKKAGG